MEKLLSFDVNDAHCYDPNEEAKLRHIISAKGKENFDQRVRELARLSLARDAVDQNMTSVFQSIKRRISGLEE